MPITSSEPMQAFVARQTPAFQTLLSKWLEELGRPIEDVAEIMISGYEGEDPQSPFYETAYVDVTFCDRCFDSRHVHLPTYEICRHTRRVPDPFRLMPEHELINALYSRECLHGWYVTSMISSDSSIHIRQFPPEPDRRALTRAGNGVYTLFELRRPS